MRTGVRSWRLRASLCTAALVGILSTIVDAHAQVSPAPQATSPDTVHLKDGTIYNGTLSEVVPGSHVVIVLPTGEARRIPADHVSYAGRAAAPVTQPAPQWGGAPGQGMSSGEGSTAGGWRPQILVHAPVAELNLISQEPELTLYVEGARAGSGWGRITSYQRVCSLPCRASMPAGAHRLAIGRGDRDPRPVRDMVSLSPGPQDAEVIYTPNGLTRGLGWVVLVGGTLGGLLLMGAGVEKNEDTGEAQMTGLSYLGLGVFVGGITGGLIMVLTKDGIEIDVRPRGPVPVGGLAL